MPQDPLIITVAPNGAHKQVQDVPAVPVTPQALASEARRCLDAGAARLHRPIRDAQGRHSLDTAGHLEALRGVRAVRPEPVSVGLRELPDFFGWLARGRVMTQVIVCGAADLQRWQALRADGTVADAPGLLLFVLGRCTAGQVTSPLDLLPFLNTQAGHPSPGPWARLVRPSMLATALRPRCGRAGRPCAGGLREQHAAQGRQPGAGRRRAGGPSRRCRTPAGPADCQRAGCAAAFSCLIAPDRAAAAPCPGHCQHATTPQRTEST